MRVLPTAVNRAVQCSLALLTYAAAAQTSSAIDQAELVRRTQQLYDAIPPGDRAPWKSYYADDAMVYDEKGRAMSKEALLDELRPGTAELSR